MGDHLAGLKSVRGTGTSGYVQLNLGITNQEIASENKNYESRRHLKRKVEIEKVAAEVEKLKRQSRMSIESNHCRDIEVKCMELRDQLEDMSENEEFIEKKVKELRSRLSAKPSKEGEDDNQSRTKQDSIRKSKHTIEKPSFKEATHSVPKAKSDSLTKPVYEYKPRYKKE